MRVIPSQLHKALRISIFDREPPLQPPQDYSLILPRLPWVYAGFGWGSNAPAVRFPIAKSRSQPAIAWIHSLEDADEEVESWCRRYNGEKPHSAEGNLSQTEELKNP